MNKTYLFIGISSLALTIVLIIQVNWILKMATIKEELFSEKANMVLSRTTESLAADVETCKKIEDCASQNNSSNVTLGENEVHKIDSTFQSYMDYYNFQIDYSFVIEKPNPFVMTAINGFEGDKYNKKLGSDNNIELKLVFPEKKQFIIAEMGSMFLISVVLIIVVLMMFWRTIWALLKEKKISEQTADFLNNMTHEFKTPLTNIGLAAKMVQKNLNAPSNDKTPHYIQIILAENKKLNLQVEQILGMTALERGEIPLHKTIVDCHEIIKDLVESFGLQIEAKQGLMITDFKATNSSVKLDKVHITNALGCLIDNSIKYSKSNPLINIQTSNIGQNLVISIADNGIGIEKAHQEQIFDKFFRIPTGDLHDVKGFGLGLAYFKKIIDLHQGKIELYSEKGKGTTFKIILPNG